MPRDDKKGAPVPVIPTSPASVIGPKFWDRPTPLPVGDAEIASVHQAVGRALSAWEALELVMAMLYGYMVESASPAAFRAYGAIASATGRADCLLSAAEVFFAKNTMDKSFYASFKELMKNYQRASAIRNDIAHGYAINVGKMSTDIPGHFLLAPLYNSRKTVFDASLHFPSPETAKDATMLREWLGRKGKGDQAIKGAKYRYTSAQIDAFSNKFGILASYIVLFTIHIPREFRRLLFPEGYASLEEK